MGFFFLSDHFCHWVQPNLLLAQCHSLKVCQHLFPELNIFHSPSSSPFPFPFHFLFPFPSLLRLFSITAGPSTPDSHLVSLQMYVSFLVDAPCLPTHKHFSDKHHIASCCSLLFSFSVSSAVIFPPLPPLKFICS